MPITFHFPPNNEFPFKYYIGTFPGFDRGCLGGEGTFTFILSLHPTFCTTFSIDPDLLLLFCLKTLLSPEAFVDLKRLSLSL